MEAIMTAVKSLTNLVRFSFDGFACTLGNHGVVHFKALQELPNLKRVCLNWG